MLLQHARRDVHARLATVLAVSAGIGACTYGFDIGKGIPVEPDPGAADGGKSSDASVDRTAVAESCDPSCACGVGQSCSFACGSEPCASNSSCVITCGDTCATTCADGATCAIDCAAGSVCTATCKGKCTMICRADAVCRCTGPGCP